MDGGHTDLKFSKQTTLQDFIKTLGSHFFDRR